MLDTPQRQSEDFYVGYQSEDLVGDSWTCGEKEVEAERFQRRKKV